MDVNPGFASSYRNPATLDIFGQESLSQVWGGLQEEGKHFKRCLTEREPVGYSVQPAQTAWMRPTSPVAKNCRHGIQFAWFHWLACATSWSSYSMPALGKMNRLRHELRFVGYTARSPHPLQPSPA
jgi:hypothetical protein